MTVMELRKQLELYGAGRQVEVMVGKGEKVIAVGTRAGSDGTDAVQLIIGEEIVA